MKKVSDNVLLAALFVVTIFIVLRCLKETYRAQQSDYRYGFVDTNTARRTSQFFDNCSPENMEDCTRNNPYEGLPLP